MQLHLELRCDIGENYGRWPLGNYATLFHHVTTTSVASGFYAGDPNTHRSFTAADDAGCQVGAHVSLPDLMVIGRRDMAVSPNDLREYCINQIGAVSAFVEAGCGYLNQGKPHGALYVMADVDVETAMAVAAAVADHYVDAPLFMPNDRHSQESASRGVSVVSEGFPDINYCSRGSPIIEPHEATWSPEVVAPVP